MVFLNSFLCHLRRKGYIIASLLPPTISTVFIILLDYVGWV